MNIGTGLPRWVDIVLSLAALAIVAPLIGIAALAVALTSRGPILFRHQRAGRGGRPFTLLKLRTMHANVGGPEVTARADPRITAVGRILRATKIDELPELWNVVRGDMALVGPRPEALRYVDLSDARWREALSVRPGITDPVTLALRNEETLLQAAERNADEFYRRFLLPYKLRGYCEYLRERTWRRDVDVLRLTIAAIVVPHRAPAPEPAAIISRVTRG
jgi:lipopolysaccharide/colanic/teichoic acid biosynthesis glycosyltransferase